MTDLHAEQPCPCAQRRTRVVFPSRGARAVWASIATIMTAWFGFLTAKVSHAPAASVSAEWSCALVHTESVVGRNPAPEQRKGN